MQGKQFTGENGKKGGTWSHHTINNGYGGAKQLSRIHGRVRRGFFHRYELNSPLEADAKDLQERRSFSRPGRISKVGPVATADEKPGRGILLGQNQGEKTSFEGKRG